MENKQELINERNRAESHVKEYYAVYKCPLCSTKFRITDKTFQMDKDKFPELIAKIIKKSNDVRKSISISGSNAYTSRM